MMRSLAGSVGNCREDKVEFASHGRNNTGLIKSSAANPKPCPTDLPLQQSSAMSSIAPENNIANPDPLQGSAVGQGTTQNNSQGHAHRRVKGGFASTNRRSEHDNKNSPVLKPPVDPHITGASNDSGSSHSHKKFAWQARSCSSDEAKDVREKKELHYGEKLAQALNRKVQHLEPERPKQGRKSARKELPLTRNEAKMELKQQLEKFRKEIDDYKAEKGDSEASGSSTKSGNRKNELQGGAEDGTETTQPVDSAPKEKPFGPQGNIRTLGCYQNESGRQVTILHGKVHGFTA